MTTTISKLLLAMGLTAAVATPMLRADVTLPKVFTDHMVLQREQPIPVWGWAEPAEKISVSLAGTLAETAEATADQNGNWLVKLPPQPAGGQK